MWAGLSAGCSQSLVPRVSATAGPRACLKPKGLKLNWKKKTLQGVYLFHREARRRIPGHSGFIEKVSVLRDCPAEYDLNQQDVPHCCSLTEKQVSLFPTPLVSRIFFFLSFLFFFWIYCIFVDPDPLLLLCISQPVWKCFFWPLTPFHQLPICVFWASSHDSLSFQTENIFTVFHLAFCLLGEKKRKKQSCLEVVIFLCLVQVHTNVPPIAHNR